MFFTKSMSSFGARAPYSSSFFVSSRSSSTSSSADSAVGSIVRSRPRSREHRVEVGVGRERAEVAQRARAGPCVSPLVAPTSSKQEREALASRRAGPVMPKSMQHGAAVGLHHEVAAVQVAVEDAVEHRAFHERRRARRAAPLRCRRRRRASPATSSHANAVEPFHHEHAPGHERRVRPRHDRRALVGLREHARRCRACSRLRAGSRAPRRSSPRTARRARAGSRARRPGCDRPGAARATPSPRCRRARARAICGRCTLTTTSSPVRSRAACTCAIDAAAIGVRSNDANTSSSERPSSSSTTRRTSSNGSAGTRSRSSLNSATSSSGKRPFAAGDDLAELDVGRAEPPERDAQPAGDRLLLTARPLRRSRTSHAPSAYADPRRRRGPAGRAAAGGRSPASAAPAPGACGAQAVDVAPPRHRRRDRRPTARRR